ncbi:MAG: hypothetical protein AAB036_07540 [Elusimicrobiota bacterium]
MKDSPNSHQGVHWMLVLLSLIYPLLRYCYFGTTPVSQIPLYIFNKSLCIYATGSLLMAVWERRSAGAATGSLWISRVMVSTALHVLISLPLMGPHYFKKLYENNTMTWAAEISMLAGVFATVAYWRPYCNSSRLSAVSLRLRTGVLLVAVHLAFIGYAGWFTPSNWQGGVPPVTLLCFLVTVVTAVMMWPHPDDVF